MIYKEIDINLKKTKKFLVHPESLMKNLDASKIIYDLADLKEKKMLQIAKEIKLPDNLVALKIPLLTKEKLKNEERGRYVIKNGIHYRLNKEAIKELFYYWIERKLEQLEESSNNSLITSSFVNIEFFYNRLHNNKFFEDLFFNMMYNFKSVDIPLSGFFTLFTSDVVYKYIVNPSEFLVDNNSVIKMLYKLKSPDLNANDINNFVYEIWEKRYSDEEIKNFIEVLGMLVHNSTNYFVRGLYRFTFSILEEYPENFKAIFENFFNTRFKS